MMSGGSYSGHLHSEKDHQQSHNNPYHLNYFCFADWKERFILLNVGKSYSNGIS